MKKLLTLSALLAASSLVFAMDIGKGVYPSDPSISQVGQYAREHGFNRYGQPQSQYGKYDPGYAPTTRQEDVERFAKYRSETSSYPLTPQSSTASEQVTQSRTSNAINRVLGR